MAIMNEEQIKENEREVVNLIKYKSIFEPSSLFTTLGIAWFVIGILLFLFGPAIGGNIGSVLSDVGLLGVVFGVIAFLIAFPIKVINEPKYKNAVRITQLDSVNTPEITKNSLLSYIRNKRYEGKGGRIDTAIKLIAEVHGDNGIDVVINILEDQTHDELVRSSAASHLGSSKDERVIEPLIKALRFDQAAKIRASAASALGNTGNSLAVQPLNEALKDSDRNVRKVAKEALKRISEQISNSSQSSS